MTASHPLLSFIREDQPRHGVAKAVISAPTEKDLTEGKPVLTRDILFGMNILTVAGSVLMGLDRGDLDAVRKEKGAGLARMPQKERANGRPMRAVMGRGSASGRSGVSSMPAP